ncbi:MAG: flippase-like domain-containing protein [Armatimonadetes bacterium]|nr:flippase-like domain-containing protein [Armatimonadota bacterium]
MKNRGLFQGDPLANVKTLAGGFLLNTRLILRTVIGMAVAGFLIHLVLSKAQADLWTELEAASKGFLLSAFGLIGLNALIGTYRWQKLLEVQGIVLPFRVVLRLTMIGQFFNLVIPGGVGGDLVKMAYVGTEAPKRTTEAVLTIMLDRILGLSGLFVVALVSVLFSLPFLAAASTTLQLAVGVVALASLAGAGVICVLLFHRQLRRLPGLRHLAGWALETLPSPVVDTLRRAMTAVDLYRSHRGAIFLGLFLSCIVHTLIALAVACIGAGFHAQGLRLWDYFLATQVANTIASIPITPGGLGGRDLVLNLFFLAAGAQAAQAGVIPPFLSVLLIFWSLVGGLFFLFERSQLAGAGAPEQQGGTS